MIDTPTAQPAFAWQVRVYYEDTDAGGVVYYANYLKFMERARSEWLRTHGIEQDALARDYNVIFVVRGVQVEYLRPARFNQLLMVSVSPRRCNGSVVDIEHVITSDVKCVTASVKLVCIDTRSFKPVKIPSLIRQHIESHA